VAGMNTPADWQELGLTREEIRQARRENFARRVGPHMQVGEIRTELVPARPGVGAHKSFTVGTACKREVQTTLSTRRADKVRCPDCLVAIKEEEA